MITLKSVWAWISSKVKSAVEELAEKVLAKVRQEVKKR